jgi:DNA helicase-2/ATP-dependent DNA helicase PcrA
MVDLLADLNDEQQRAVKTTDGPVLILAGAGSGKTKTLTHRVAYLIGQGLATPSQILAVTFTNKAATEMRERVAKLLGTTHEHYGFMPYMGTFHKICVRLLRQDGQLINLNPNFVIFDEDDSRTLIRRLLKQLMLDEKQYPPSLISNLISGAKNEMLSPSQYAEIAHGPVQKIAAKIYPLYEQGLKDHGGLDFDNIIGFTVELLQNHPQAKTKWQNQFKYILIDEYQDTNPAQYKLIKLLTNKRRNICVCGDDWQSIFGFRNADFRNILNFERDYKEAVIIKLEQNYRSTKHILDAAHAVISKNRQRSEKKLWTAAGPGEPVQMVPVLNERAEGEAIIRRIQSGVDIANRQYGDFAVLYRTNAQSRALEEQFVRRNVPYKIVGGVRFYERAEIKDVMAYLRLIYQPQDLISFMRIVNVPTRGIGAKSLQNFLQWQAKNKLTLDEALSRVKEAPLTAKAQMALSDFADVIKVSRESSQELAVADLLNGLLRRIDYLKYLNDGTIQGEARAENVRELLSVAKAYSEVGLDSFLEEVALVSDLDAIKNDHNAVTLMTLHSAKGLEFPVVFMAGLEESLLPHSKSLYEQSEMEEERRLCYVGMTRAKEELYMLYADSRILYGSIQHNPPSRFLSEIDSEFQKHAPLLDFSSFNLEPSTITSNEPRYILELVPGDGVQHQVFGKGTVLEIDGDNATIYFKGKGAKKLNLAFAPLEKL